MRHFCKILLILFIALTQQYCLLAQTKASHSPRFHPSFSISLVNPTTNSRQDESVILDVKALSKVHSAFDFGKYEISEAGKPIYAELLADEQGKPDRIAVNLSFAAKERKTLTFTYSEKPVRPESVKRTQAYMGVKTDYMIADNTFTGGRFVSQTKVTMTKAHAAHDALYQYEGPGWESDKIAYRFYLDSRNRMDIFGKKTDDVVMHKVGVNDLVSDSKESYTKMQDWGMDIFKVGNSLGIGSIAYYLNGKAVTVSETDSMTVNITNNNNLFSGLTAGFYGWNFGKGKTNVTAAISIEAGSRLTKLTVSAQKAPGGFCTGLAKHENTVYLESPTSDRSSWGYIALYGQQALSGDSLGIAVFYNKKQLIKRTEDEVSRLVVLKPVQNSVTYYFAAGWQQEKKGIASQAEFVSYLNNTILSLSNPIRITY